MQYTCAYFQRPGQSLEQAQLVKKRHLAAKLLLAPDQRVLDVGSGWGGLCLYLAEVAGVRATGVTLSQRQFETSQRRARERGLSDRVDFQLKDYRKVRGRFDRIVSVGMFEAIGKKEFNRFFQTAASLLDRHGVFVLHSIGRTKKNPVPNPWLQRYIFPGSYIPSLSEVLPPIERAGFIVTDLEILRLHYAETLRAWRERFVRRRAEVLELFDERFYRTWEFYLAASEAGFRIDRMFIFQVQLARHQDTVPLCRDYVARTESELSRLEAELPAYASVGAR
jgi:cyclopropane-fatty-acyl-phospholipid synthase